MEINEVKNQNDARVLLSENGCAVSERYLFSLRGLGIAKKIIDSEGVETASALGLSLYAEGRSWVIEELYLGAEVDIKKFKTLEMIVIFNFKAGPIASEKVIWAKVFIFSLFGAGLFAWLYSVSSFRQLSTMRCLLYIGQLIELIVGKPSANTRWSS